MTISNILTQALFGKKVKTDVEFYDSIICKTGYSKNELVEIKSVEIFDNGDNTIRGIILGGEHEGKECNFYLALEKEFKFID